MRDGLDRLFRDGQVVTLDVADPRPDGTDKRYACHFGSIRVEGHVATAIGIAGYITGRVRLERQVLEVSEEERLRIDPDLQDGMGQILTGISLLVRGLGTTVTCWCLAWRCVGADPVV